MDRRYKNYFLLTPSHIDEVRAEIIKDLKQQCRIKIHPPYGHKYPSKRNSLGGIEKEWDGYDMMISVNKGIATKVFEAYMRDAKVFKCEEQFPLWEEI